MTNTLQAPTYGLEEEVMVIDRGTLSPAAPHDGCVAELNARLGTRFAPEYKKTVIELVTGIHTSVFDLTDEAAANRNEASVILARHGYAALPLATHPWAESLTVPAREGERYRRIETQKGDAVRHLAANGVHLHVGTYEGDAERLRHLPKLIHLTALHAAVTASSPFAEGHDTGQASWRLRILMQLASSLPLMAADPDELAQVYRALASAGGPKDASEQWGLVRLGAGKPTIEFRAADTMPSLDEVAWLAAITGAAAYAERMGMLPPLAPSVAASAYLYAANLDRVAAEGAEAVLVDPFDWEARTITETVDAWIARLAPAIDALALGDAIALRPARLAAPWRDMKTFTDEIEVEALARGLGAADARSLAFRRMIERALMQAATTPKMPWACTALAA
jgi:carboxylate-amine ligase